jgi:hypothetical protein
MPPLTIKPLGALAQTLTNLFQAPPSTIRGVDTTDWFGPLQPIRPIAPEGTEPRGFQYYPGQNLIYTPRADEEYTAEQLRTASEYPLARTLIENVKDLVSRLPINVRLRRMPGETGKDYAKRKPDNAKLRDLADILDHPNPDENRQEFMRKLVEDMLVIDAASVLFRTSRKGQLMELRSIDGALITRYIDEQGYTPQPPSPAYAEVWYGTPMVDLTTRQLLYAARNIRPHRIYGYSPTAQAMPLIRLGMERLKFKLNAYEEGTIPDAMQIVPPGVPPDKIREAQNWINSDLAGNLAKRRQLRLIQGFHPEGKDQVLFPKQALLADTYDELEIMELCFIYGVSKQRLTKQMNRAASQMDQEAADKEGSEPWLDWAANSIWNKIIQDYLGFKEYEAVYDDQVNTDPLKQAQMNEIEVKTGRKTINEWREDDGDDPRPEPEADQLMVYTGTGPIPLTADDAAERAKTMSAAAPQPAKSGALPEEQSEPSPATSAKVLIDTVERLHKAAGRLLASEHASNGNGNGRARY